MSWSKQKKYKEHAQCLTEEGITLLLITCYHCKLDSGRMGRNEPGNNEENYQVVCFESSNRWVKDNLIHCFKEDEPCKAIKEILKNQLSILTKKNVKPFEIDENDVVVATQKFMIVYLNFFVIVWMETLTLTYVIICCIVK